MPPPLFSVLVTSHQRPGLLRQALDSVLAQTYRNFEVLVVDSGALVDKIEGWDLSGVDVVASGEPADLHKTTIMPSWVLNRWIPWTKGDWIVSLCDDDLLLPTYLAAFADQVPAKPGPAFLYSGQFRVRANADGAIYQLLGHVRAAKPGLPGDFKCKVDYLQMAFNRALWNELCARYTNRPFPEELQYKNCPDGIFMERAALITPARPVAGYHSFNRRTPSSRYCGA